MRFGKIVVILISISVLTSMSFLPGEKNTYFNEKEMELMSSTAAAIGFGYGYDDQLDLPYVFRYPYADSDARKNKRQFADAIENAEAEVVKSFYYKVLKMKYMAEYLRDMYKERERWANYTFLKDKLLPSIDAYHAVLKYNIQNSYGNYISSIEKREKRIQKRIYEIMDYKEKPVDTF